MDGIIGEVSQSIIACTLSPFSDGNVGMDMGILDSLDVLIPIRMLNSNIEMRETHHGT